MAQQTMFDQDTTTYIVRTNSIQLELKIIDQNRGWAFTLQQMCSSTEDAKFAYSKILAAIQDEAEESDGLSIEQIFVEYLKQELKL